MISPDNVFAVGAILCALAFLGFWMDGQRIGQKVPGVVWVLSTGMLLSNLHIIPFTSPLYDFVGASLVPLAIPMLLFKANLRRIFRESGVVLFTFLIAGTATAVAAMVGFYLFDLGPSGTKVAGMYAAGWIGGSVNVLAVSQAVEMTPEEFTIALGAGSPVSNLALLLLVIIPSVGWLRRLIPSRNIGDNAMVQAAPDATAQSVPQFLPTHIAGIIALSFTICALSTYFAEALSWGQYSVLFISVLAVAVANLFPATMDKVKGDFELGLLLMYLFFASVGAGTNATAFLTSAVVYFSYGLFIIVAHLAIVLVAAKLSKIDLADAVVGSAAALVGPAVTAAIATSQGWRDLVTPGILCGVLGYAVGTFAGVSITAVLN